MPQKNAADKVYEALEAAILLGQLKPRERIIERDLVARFNVSRTPIREALTRLGGVGLVHAKDGRRVLVSDFTREEIRDLYYLRETLERAAAKLIVKHVTLTDIEDARRINDTFRKACEKENLRTMIESNNAFHRRLFEITKNRFLIEDLEQARLKAFLVRYSFWAKPGAAKASANEHEDMLNALAQHDRRNFERVVLKHLNVAKETYLAQHFWK